MGELPLLSVSSCVCFCMIDADDDVIRRDALHRLMPATNWTLLGSPFDSGLAVI
jgi:hypothetical protein